MLLIGRLGPKIYECSLERHERQNAVFIRKRQLHILFGITSSTIAINQTLYGTACLVSFYADDMSPSFHDLERLKHVERLSLHYRGLIAHLRNSDRTDRVAKSSVGTVSAVTHLRKFIFLFNSA
jgi:hypothetical protein